jgi:hypothetical protein
MLIFEVSEAVEEVTCRFAGLNGQAVYAGRPEQDRLMNPVKPDPATGATVATTVPASPAVRVNDVGAMDSVKSGVTVVCVVTARLSDWELACRLSPL